jgi:hypothetical protein
MPQVCPKHDLLGRAEPEANIPGSILAKVVPVEDVRIWAEPLDGTQRQPSKTGGT